MRRNFERWTKQYEKSKMTDIPSMARLQQWLPGRVPPHEACTVVHGDFRYVHGFVQDQYLPLTSFGGHIDVNSYTVYIQVY